MPHLNTQEFASEEAIRGLETDPNSLTSPLEHALIACVLGGLEIPE